jgi:soluble cytochrome b562
MKKLLFLLASLILVAPASAQTAAQPPARPAQKQKKEKGRPDTDLEKAMDKMGGAFRKLRQQAKEGKFGPDAAEHVAKMQAAAAEAKKLEPLKAKEIPAADRAKFTADFREKLDEFSTALDGFAAALKAGDQAVAMQQFEKIGKLQRSDHEKFQPKDY